jgi:hypothetical protein
MKAIGEEPQEFASFRDEFRNPTKPNDDFEDLLACKMVAARWRPFPTREGPRLQSWRRVDTSL